MSIKQNICNYAEVISNLIASDDSDVVLDDFAYPDIIKELFTIKNIKNKKKRIYSYYNQFGEIIEYSKIHGVLCQHLWLYAEIVNNKLFTVKKFQKYMKNITIKMSGTQFMFACTILLRRKR